MDYSRSQANAGKSLDLTRDSAGNVVHDQAGNLKGMGSSKSAGVAGKGMKKGGAQNVDDLHKQSGNQKYYKGAKLANTFPI